MRKKVAIKKLMTLLLLISSNPCWSGVSGQVIAFSCINCHSHQEFKTKSNTLPSKISTVHFIEEQLLRFKYNQRESTIMGRIAKGYSDVELKAVAHYLANTKQ